MAKYNMPESTEQADNREILMRERKQRSQKQMAWVALASVVVFTTALFTPVIGVDRVSALSDLLGLFYISMAGVVGAFMGVSAWMSKR